nr:MAG TPA: hypothetical protein [Caudoviricetes sp.]
MQVLLAMDVASEKSKQQLEELGVEATNEMLLAFATFQQAVKGNQRAVENVIKLSTSDKDKHDISEQKERIKSLKVKNKHDERLLDTDITSKRVIEINVGGWDDND